MTKAHVSIKLEGCLLWCLIIREEIKENNLKKGSHKKDVRMYITRYPLPVTTELLHSTPEYIFIYILYINSHLQLSLQ